MNKKINYLCLLTTIILFFSCTSKVQTITPKSTTIKGELGEYFEIVQKDYILNKEKSDSEIIIEVKRNDKALPYSSISALNSGIISEYIAGFGIELFNEDNPILIREPNDHFYMPSKGISNLLKLKSGETTFLSWSIDNDKIDKINCFQLTSSLSKEDLSAEESSSILEENNKDDVDGNWDKFLNDYEAYIDNYIELLKKANNGDLSALEKYPSLLENAQKMDKRIREAEKNKKLSSSEISRMMKIQTKLLKASSDL